MMVVRFGSRNSCPQSLGCCGSGGLRRIIVSVAVILLQFDEMTGIQVTTKWCYDGARAMFWDFDVFEGLRLGQFDGRCFFLRGGIQMLDSLMKLLANVD